MRALRLLILAFLPIVLSGCWMLDLPPIPTGVVALDQPFTLKASQSVKLAGEPVRIRLEPWAEDKRCPQDTTCNEDAPVRIQISFWRDDHSTTYPVFSVHTDPDGAVIETVPETQSQVKLGPYQVQVTAVRPYPATQQEIPYRDYQATLVVTRDPSAAPDTDADTSVIPGNPFVLAAGEQVSLVGRNVSLKIDQVSAVPCSPDQDCTTNAAVHLDWLENNVLTHLITLTATIDDAGQVLPPTSTHQPFTLVDGVGLRLIGVTEPPVETGAPGDYRVRLMLEPGPRMPNGSVYAEPDEPFTLIPDQTAVVGMDFMRVRFDTVLEDSRCPVTVECIQAGKVLVGVTVSSQEQRATTYVLGGSTDELGNLLGSSEINHGFYTLRLESVTPYPQTTEPISTTAYQATFIAIAPPGTVSNVPQVSEATETPQPSGEALPLLCVNEFAAVRMSIGGAEEPVVQFTDPIRRDQAPGYGEAHALCNKPFGPEWVQAGPTTPVEKANYIPSDTPFWVWDGSAGGLVRFPPTP